MVRQGEKRKKWNCYEFAFGVASLRAPLKRAEWGRANLFDIQTPTEDPLPSCLDEEECEPGNFLINVMFS